MIRYIEDFSKTLNKIIDLKESRKYAVALELIEDFYSNHLDLNKETIQSLNEDELYTFVEENDKNESDKWAILADLLLEEADIYHSQNLDGQSNPLFIKALNLFLYLVQKEKTTFTISFRSKIEEIFSKTIIYDLPFRVKLRLLAYFESSNKFATAEDLIFNLLETYHDTKYVRDLGIAFYERLLKKDDQILKAGLLPRDEIEEGLARIRTRRNFPD